DSGPWGRAPTDVLGTSSFDLRTSPDSPQSELIRPRRLDHDHPELDPCRGGRGRVRRDGGRGHLHRGAPRARPVLDAMSTSLVPTPSPDRESVPPARRRALDVDIVIPVYNERLALEGSVRMLHGYLSATFPFSWQITIVDNASTDGTLQIARRLMYELPRVGVIHLPAKGRGRALRTAWSVSRAEVLAYMDVDLSTDLAALLPLVSPLLSGHSDVAIGTRLHHASRITRSRKRELISRCYNRLLALALRARFSDAQCGFKAIRAGAAAELLPLI